MGYFIDTHVHFYDEAYGAGWEAALKRSLAAGVKKMIQPDIDSKERDKMFSISESRPGVLFTMLGLYPGSVDENWEDEMAKMEPYLSRGIVAVGEIGLDYHYSADTAQLQKRAFLEQMRMAAKLDLPVNIHMRDATEDFFAIMDQCKSLGISGCLHAFSGSAETFRRLEKYGDWYVGIGGVVTFKHAKVAESVKEIPLERIVLETDAPYLAPTPHRGELNESTYIPLIANKIAELKGISVEDVRDTTTRNAERLFRLDAKQDDKEQR
jgi:TatD DNase family protein